jgi:hypothetical protein
MADCKANRAAPPFDRRGRWGGLSKYIGGVDIFRYEFCFLVAICHVEGIAFVEVGAEFLNSFDFAQIVKVGIVKVGIVRVEFVHFLSTFFCGLMGAGEIASPPIGV